MAGHSKWANIQHRKSKQDAKRAKLFTKLIREMTIAARLGGEDPSSNPRLRLAIDKGLLANIPKNTIDRAVKRGTGEVGGDPMEEIRYEGYGPKGVALLIDTVTDNRKRTVAEIRHTFSRYGGNLGSTGSVAYLFKKKGIITFLPGTDAERILDLGLEAYVEDMVFHSDNRIDVIVSEMQLNELKKSYEAKNLRIANAGVTWFASAKVALSAADKEILESLIEALEDLEDVQSVYSNQTYVP